VLENVIKHARQRRMNLKAGIKPQHTPILGNSVLYNERLERVTASLPALAPATMQPSRSNVMQTLHRDTPQLDLSKLRRS
jgi:hypothetical protein